MRVFLERAAELVQYNHIIHTAASTYIWDNVYVYDKEFRMHLANFPQRSWSIILQQAWAICLKDKIPARNFSENKFGNKMAGGKRKSVIDLMWENVIKAFHANMSTGVTFLSVENSGMEDTFVTRKIKEVVQQLHPQCQLITT